jgi:ribosome-associated heat shock protein Hsp15
MPSTPEARVRADKWLWAARMYKSRSLAAKALETGQARVENERVKPSRALKVGERISVRKSGLVWEIEILALAEKRGGAADAALLYREAPESAAGREEEIAKRKAVALGTPQSLGRPTKRQRRKLEDFLNEA